MVKTTFLAPPYPESIIPAGPWYLEDPTATSALPIHPVYRPITLVLVHAQTDAGTVDFNIERRADGSAFSAGTDAFASDLQATTSGVNQTAFATPHIAGDGWLWLVASAVASSPTKLVVKLAYLPSGD